LTRLRNPNFVLGIIVLLAAALAIFVWVPLDTGSGLIQHVRGQEKIGDAMAPTVVLCVLGVAGALLMWEARTKPTSAMPTRSNLRYVGLLFGMFLLSILLMRWTGPAAVHIAGIFDPAITSYRDLRDTVPWKYLGFLTGGTFMVAGLICILERRITWRAVIIGFAAVLVLIALYGVPFHDLLLPPNGDL
jgi:hypothetical protein